MLTFKKWNVGIPNRELAKQTAMETGIDPFTVMLAQLRGITDATELDYYTSDELLISSPDELVDIETAADIINEYIDQKLKIAIFGDYDCDGICASAIIYKYLKRRGADVFVYIPDRLNEGYGMNKDAVDVIFRNGCKLIITVDNGISCKDEIDYASGLGIVTVVTDHHLPPEQLPDAAAVVDPNRKDCPSSFKEICGAEVAFKVVCKADGKEPEELIDDYAELLTIATIGDSMPLVWENRSIVKYGIRHIISAPSVAVKAILSVAGIDRMSLDSGRLAYGIVPRINAAGRMGEANKAFELLVSEDVMVALKYANEIEEYNAQRQSIEKKIVLSVCNEIETNCYNHDRVIVVSGRDYHIGVLGIVASKICEKYGRPTIILSSDGVISKGSCRSLGDFNIFKALKSCEKFIIKYGGHALAAGLTVKEDNVSALRKEINDYALSFAPAVPSLNLDFKLNPAAISVDMAYSIKSLEPFGNENPAPLFGIYGVTLTAISEISHGKHLRLSFRRDGYAFTALLFNVTRARFPFQTGAELDIAVTLSVNTYMNSSEVSIFIKDIRPCGINEDEILSDIRALDNYYSCGVIDAARLKVSREDIASVYKVINRNELCEQAVFNRFYDTIGYSKTYISIAVLKELNLITVDNQILKTTASEKTELFLSDTYKKLGIGGENGVQ
ncbi:MAG TPA: single-stranded-DNA-specific exonuclease RecJ [Ruminococcaceae bacterium]|nr:single-stranded-DNA-specific exonuclease RecJ [Oscillospiraceae bacterium]